MTIICAARDASGTYLACDLMSRVGDLIHTVKTKLVLTERWAMGFAGIARFRQLAERNAEDLDQCDDACHLANAIRHLIIEDGAQRNEGRGEAPSFEVESVLVDRHNGDLFRIVGDCSLLECDRFAAAGSGVETALGAMWAISQRGHVGARELVELGIGAASHLSAGCGRGMVVEKVWAPAAKDAYPPTCAVACTTADCTCTTTAYRPGEIIAIPHGMSPLEFFERDRRRRREASERIQDHVDQLCGGEQIERYGLTVLQAQQVEGGF